MTEQPRMTVSERLRLWLAGRPEKKIRLWTTAGYSSGTVISIDDDFLELHCYVNNSRAAETVTVVIASISSWA